MILFLFISLVNTWYYKVYQSPKKLLTICFETIYFILNQIQEVGKLKTIITIQTLVLDFFSTFLRNNLMKIH